MATTTKVTTAKQLTEIAQTVGKKYGYERVEADFSPFADFKVKWTRSYKWAEFTVSDYLIGANKSIINDLFDCLFNRISGGEAKPYTKRFTAHVTSPDFAEAHRPTYLTRKRAEKESNREFCGTPVFYSKREMSEAGYMSTLMNAIVLNSELKNAPSEVVDAIVAHEYNKIQEGVSMFGGTPNIVHCDTQVANDWLVRNGIRGIC